MNASVLGPLAGLLGGLGGSVVLWRLTTRRPHLVARVAPYLQERSPTSGLLSDAIPHSAFPTLERLFAPVLKDGGRLLERLGSTSASIRGRLTLAGDPMTLEQFRLEQLLWAALGLASGLGVTAVLGAAGGSLGMLLLLCLLGAVAGALLRDQVLTHVVRRRAQRMTTELPDVAELLALTVSAGEGVLSALERVTATSHGLLTSEIRRVLVEARSGVPLVVAIERLGRRTDASSVTRFAEAVTVAIDRGTPLAEVLRAQSVDAREAARRALMESGGRKELAMMVPVVFLILPVTVLFAIFPGLAVLRVGL